MIVSNSAQVKIRNFLYPGDYEQVYALWGQAGSGIHLRRSDTPEEIQKKLQRDPDLFLVAEIEDKMVGAVLGGLTGGGGWFITWQLKRLSGSKGLEKL
jgi:ribosomal protein S18 acetylase RimI-like enzyme